MSSQKGNVQRSRPQKYKNATAFKNTKYDTSQRTKDMLGVGQDGLCERCAGKIEWKIKYKKYKPLTQPASCTRCRQKTVKKAYYTVCQPCATSLGVCAKCAQKKEVSQYAPDERTQAAEQREMEQQIKMMSERERRTLLRLKAQGKLIEDADKNNEDSDDLDRAADDIGDLNCDDDSDIDDCDDDGKDGVAGKVDAYSLFE